MFLHEWSVVPKVEYPPYVRSVVISLYVAPLKKDLIVPKKFLNMERVYLDWLHKNHRVSLSFEAPSFSHPKDLGHPKDTCYTVYKADFHSKQNFVIE